MMNKKRTNRAFSAKYALFAPLAFALLFVSNIELIAREANNWIETQMEVASQKMDIDNETAAPVVDATTDNTMNISDQQTTTKQQDPIFVVVEKMPVFPGGEQEMLRYIAKNLKYPVEAQTKKEQGRVIISFTINKEGKIVDPVIVRGVSPSLNAEAVRIIKSMPDWTPGMQKEKKVNVKYTIPILFKLDGLENKNPDASTSEKNEIVAVAYPPKEAPTEMSIENVTFTVVEEMPQFPGGEKAMLDYLSKNVKYPEEDAKKGIQGRVIVSFVINRNGKAVNPIIVRGVTPTLDAEAVRVIENMPDWTPGKQKGQNVNVKYTLPINFRIPQANKSPGDSKSDIKPMIIIDGKEHTYAEYEALSKTSLKPDMIENISVLKGKGATDLYGEKGKDGVIVIKTKK